ncbi:MAG: FkbM family methyltransferase, partial [Fusobacteriaceae bacterium]|nr:FkbM family methyltransferase [Fusobacteriaceae bacterium]
MFISTEVRNLELRFKKEFNSNFKFNIIKEFIDRVSYIDWSKWMIRDSNYKKYKLDFPFDKNSTFSEFSEYFNMLIERGKENFKNIDFYDNLFKTFDDELSKNVLCSLLIHNLTGSFCYLNEVYDEASQEYFPNGIIQCTDNEIFVDCGAFHGETVIDFINKYSKYKKIYSYEPEFNNYNKAKMNLESYVDVILINKGVFNKNTTISFFSNRGDSSRIDKLGEGKIEVICLDDDIKEKVTFIKMDVEGAERKALEGAKKLILKYYPKLAICVYHKADDLRILYGFIKKININYKFYLRHHSQLYYGTVLYAVPK